MHHLVAALFQCDILGKFESRTTTYEVGRLGHDIPRVEHALDVRYLQLPIRKRTDTLDGGAVNVDDVEGVNVVAVGVQLYFPAKYASQI